MNRQQIYATQNWSIHIQTPPHLERTGLGFSLGFGMKYIKNILNIIFLKILHNVGRRMQIKASLN